MPVVNVQVRGDSPHKAYCNVPRLDCGVLSELLEWASAKQDGNGDT